MRKPTRRACSIGAKRSKGVVAAPPLAAHGHLGVDNAFERLPDDLVITVLAGLAACAACSADLVAAALT